MVARRGDASDIQHGAVVIHGFTGSPASMRGVATALADNGFHVELPRLPGHGTHVDDMLPTRWADWAGEAEAAYQRLRQRATDIVVVGLSMGGALTLRLGADHPDVAGLVCINPVAQPQAPEIVEMLRGLARQRHGRPPWDRQRHRRPRREGERLRRDAGRAVAVIARRRRRTAQPLYAHMRIPLLLMNSPQDHVVEPAQAEYLVDNYGGPVERILLERSYHVATQDYDKDLIQKSTTEFAARVTAR